MTHRDDFVALQAKNENLEAEKRELQHQLDMERGKPDTSRETVEPRASRQAYYAASLFIILMVILISSMYFYTYYLPSIARH